MATVREIEQLKREVEDLKSREGEIRGRISQMKAENQVKDSIAISKELAKLAKDKAEMEKKIESLLAEYKEKFNGLD